MKKLLSILFALISFAAFAQPGSLSQSVYRSRVNDSTTINGATASGYGYFLWNNQKAVPSWQFWNGTTLVDWNPSSAGGGAVSSVFTRTGAVTAQSGDYTGTQITNTPAGNIAATTAQAAINELDAEKANEQVTHNIQTGSNYTLVLTDADTKSILMRALAAQTLTIPPVSSVAFPEGTMIILTQDSTGGLSVVAGSGVVIESSAGNLVSPGQDSPMVLEKKNASNSWFLRNGTPAITGAALTKVDDTNVTLTLGGTPSAALLAASSLTLGWTGDLAYSRLTQGSALSVLGVTGNATADVASIAAATDGHILRRSGTSVGFGKVLTNYITGTATNDAATAGDIGEEVNAIVSTYTNYATTATYQNITSITLTAGDWDLSAFFTYSSNSATITAASNAIFVISTTTASAAGATEGRNIGYVPQAALLGTSLFSEAIAPYRVSISGSTTYYLNSQATFTLGNPQYVGGLRARRVR